VSRPTSRIEKSPEGLVTTVGKGRPHGRPSCISRTRPVIPGMRSRTRKPTTGLPGPSHAVVGSGFSPAASPGNDSRGEAEGAQPFTSGHAFGSAAAKASWAGMVATGA
jgi:hypothetical protein